MKKNRLYILLAALLLAATPVFAGGGAANATNFAGDGAT